MVFLTTGTIWAEPPNRLDGEVSGLASFYERGEISAPHQLNHPVFRQGYSRLHFKNALGRMGILAAPFSSGFNSTLEFSLRQTRLDDARNSLSMVRLGSS
ncbi:MAG: hypothetical protein GWN72_14005, partial [Nitrospinaceae bacterium]|nr:hypothetical protein [Nitrospinaceae bacterium]NIU97442.1 hypothetical protein [Nitrospinaceae bacterium]NIW60014.1 hypothetical protein [Nitrospinaceae bacterium]